MSDMPAVEWRRSAVDPLTYHATHPLFPERALCAKGQAWGIEPGKVLSPTPYEGLPRVDALCMGCLCLLDPELYLALASCDEVAAVHAAGCEECEQRDQT